MPSAKRASMREGPLAALFRKTAQDVDDSARAPDARATPPAAPDTPESAPAADERAGTGGAGGST